MKALLRQAGAQSTGRKALTWIVLLAGTLDLVGCDSALPNVPMKGELGCSTVDELVNRYKSAHSRRDIDSLRPLLFWNAQALTRVVRDDEEAAMIEIFSHRLVAIAYKEAPWREVSYRIEDGQGTETVGGVFAKGTEYYDEKHGGIAVPKGRRDRMMGSVRGKLMLVVDKETDVDPGFIVMEFQGRYYIDTIKFVLLEAADALKAGRTPKYIAEPLDKKLPLPLE
jgi:hypothetical protein